MVGSVELWREADAVLDRLLDLEPGEREAALAAMPLSRDLRETVARLLAAHRDESGVLDRAVHEAPTSALRGRRLGRWELEHEIGRGGMAVVYRAHAIDAPTQVAAVKLLTLGALGRGVERFQQEQAVLARLRHPHIATLFDSGTAPDGTPWLAMALVDGVRIDAWCERRALAPREIVRLFLDVCDAVAHAHRNLVIHRDLKPSNVLVDHDGHVRLLDFGIARLADEQGEATATQWRALTPEYAAPEQFDGAPPSTAMDVHGLGALLYRLLVGTSPRSGATARDADVTTPSRALRDARRASVMRGDLDAVLVKALARDPQRRYESVGALQRDLVAWLERRPVAARTPSLGYRLSRFVARNRLAVAATTAIALAILVGAALALWQAQRANAQSELAQRNAARATSVRDFLVSLFESADPEREGGAVASTREIVALGAERARSELAADPALRAEMLRVIGAIQRRLGATDDAAATLDAASDAARAAGAALPAVESAQLGYERGVLQSIAGDLDAAERSFEGIAGLLASDEGAAAGVLRAQALGELVVVAQGRGDLDSAFARLADAEAAVARLEPPNPYERMVVRNLRVAVLNDAGRYAEASALATEIVADARTSGIADRGTFAQLLANASKLADAAGDRPLAVAHAEEGVRFARARYPAGHFVVADAMLALGNAYRTSGRHAEAAQALREAMAMFGAGGRTGQRGETAMVLGRSLVDNGDPRAALELADAELAAAGEWEDRPATRVLGLLDVALRAARELDRAAFVRHAADAERELAALPEDLRAQPMVQRVRRRLAQWRFDDGVVDEAARLAADGIAASSAAPAPTADELIMRAVAVRASRVEREATAEFDRIVAALALQPSLGAAEAEARLAIAQAAMAIGRADAKAYLDAALQAHAAKPLPAALAAQLDALAARR